MARLGRAQPFRPLFQAWSYTQVRLSAFTMAGVGTLSLIGASLGAGVLSSAGTGDAAFTASTPPGGTFLRIANVNQTVNRSSVY